MRTIITQDQIREKLSGFTTSSNGVKWVPLYKGADEKDSIKVWIDKGTGRYNYKVRGYHGESGLKEDFLAELFVDLPKIAQELMKEDAVAMQTKHSQPTELAPREESEGFTAAGQVPSLIPGSPRRPLSLKEKISQKLRLGQMPFGS